MIDAMSEVAVAAERLSIRVDWRRLCAALHRSIRVPGGRDALSDAILRDLRIERSPMRRMADQQARLRADALLST